MQKFKFDLQRTLFIIIGTFLIALSTNAVLIPNKLLSGGINGIATFLHFLFDWNVGLLVILLNIPLFIVAILFLKRHFIVFSLFGMLMLSFWLEVTKNISIATDDTLSIIILGGLLNGLGSGIIFRGDGSTGGSDIIAKIINKHFSLSMASVNLIINGIIICFSIYFFGLDLSILTLATMFVASRVTHFVVDGVNYKRTLFIITDEMHYKAMADDIMSELLRGVTIIPALGAYTQANRYILYTTVGIRELAKIKSIVASHDKAAFVTVTPTAQVFGNGRGFMHNIIE